MKSTPPPFNFDEDRVYPMHPCCHTVEEMRRHERPENRETTCPVCMDLYRRDGIEVLPAFRERECGMWRVWCRYCKAWHTHSPEFGHREAHCHDLFIRRKVIPAHEHSGYHEKGYAVAFAGEWKDREVKA